MSYPEFYGHVQAITELRGERLMRSDTQAMDRIAEIVAEFKAAQAAEAEALKCEQTGGGE